MIDAGDTEEGVVEQALSGDVRVGWSRRRGRKLFIVSRRRLSLRCLRRYDFTPEQIVSIERDGPSWLDSGVR